MKTSLFFLFFASIASASLFVGEAQVARFEPWLTRIAAPLAAGDASDVAEEMLNGDTRLSAFYLQGLGKIYQNIYPGFGSLRSTFKDLEDAIGDFNKWAGIYEKALEQGASKKKLEELKKKRDKARETFEDFLVQEEWVVTSGTNRLDQIQKALKANPWLSYDDDRKAVIEVLRGHLKAIEQGDWDLSRLEEGDGLHELRREIRWFQIMARSLNGMLTFRADQYDCPVDEFKDLVDKKIASSKYAQLPQATTEPRPCLVSQCLYLAMANAVEELGDLKDEAEVYNNSHDVDDIDEVPSHLQAEAEKILKQIEDTDLMGEMRDQLKECK